MGGGEAPKIFRHPKRGLVGLGGVSENLYTSKLTGGLLKY